MPQIMYSRPWPEWVALAIILPLTIPLIVVVATQGTQSPASWIILAVEIVTLITITILDPQSTIESRKTLPDGQVVTVRRPIIGFKEHERAVGVTGGYEVRVDGYRYEAAYLRI